MQRFKLLTILAFLNFVYVQAQTEVNEGDTIPGFKAIDHNEKEWQLQNWLNKADFLVVYFYPAAMTGGCTKQACAFRDSKSSLDSLNVTVVGVSGDKPQNLDAFRKMHQLNFTMLSDFKGEIATLFGVPTRKGGTIERDVDGEKMSLERGITTSRWTFVLNKAGKVVFKDTDENVNTESKALLSWLKANK